MQKKAYYALWLVFTPDLTKYALLKSPTGGPDTVPVPKLLNGEPQVGTLDKEAAKVGIKCKNWQFMGYMKRGTYSDNPEEVHVYVGIADLKSSKQISVLPTTVVPAKPHYLRWLMPLLKHNAEVSADNDFVGFVFDFV